MKIIRKNDLIAVIALIDDRTYFDLYDFSVILNRFGEERYIEDGTTEITVKKSDELKKIRDHYTLKNEDDLAHTRSCVKELQRLCPHVIDSIDRFIESLKEEGESECRK